MLPYADKRMPSLLTYCILFMTMLGAVTLRLRWPRLSARSRLVLKLMGVVALAPALLSMATKWDVMNHRVWMVEGWTRMVACQFAIVFFTLLRPRFLTVATAVVLIPFTFSTVVTGPLSDLFRSMLYRQQHIGDRYYLDTHPWESGSGANSGVDFDLYYMRSPTAYVRRAITGTRLYNSQCRTDETYATLSPETHTVTVFCPPLAAASVATAGAVNAASGTELRYYIPRGALSPELRRQWREDPHPHLDEERPRR